MQLERAQPHDNVQVYGLRLLENFLFNPAPTNIASDMGSLEEETNLPGTLPEVRGPC